MGLTQSILDRVTQFFADRIPLVRKTVYDARTSPLSLASQLDVDGILEVFAAAEKGDVVRLFALYRDILISDTHIQTEFGKRLLAVLGDPLSVLPADKKNAQDTAAAAEVQGMAKVPGWLDACAHLMAGTLWPVSVVEKVYAVNTAPGSGSLRYRLSRLVPVPFELLDFTMGRLRIRETDAAGLFTGVFLEPDPANYIVHRGHLLPTPDFWGGPFRSLVFWWFFAAMGRDSWARFLERYGAPFMVGKFDQADDASRSVLEHAFSQATRLFGVVVSRETEVEIQQAAAKDSGEAFQAFHETANKEKSKLILGQTMSAEAQSTGIGQGASPQHETVRQDIRQFDAARLAATLTDQLVTQFCQINGLQGAVKLVFGGESGEEATETALLLKTLKDAGIQVTDEGLPLVAERLGLQIERVAAPVPALPPPTPANGGMPALSSALLALTAQALSRNALDRMPGGAPAALSRRFRAGTAPLRAVIDAASSPEELLAHVRALSVGWEDAETAALLLETLSTYAADGSVSVLEA